MSVELHFDYSGCWKVPHWVLNFPGNLLPLPPLALSDSLIKTRLDLQKMYRASTGKLEGNANGSKIWNGKCLKQEIEVEMENPSRW